ncbi:MAG: asparagine synthase (glutamine-hydrolyzing) [Clostridia bacterium]|nr:asparagine synthase (glutamine-hydrolyzing) [Clostridia bacterium]
MCSICGLINFKRDIDEKISKVEKMGRVLKHRGLDDSGVFEFEFGAFAHNRLSVMDPDNGAQPMSVVYKGKKYTICYNGEVYNFREIKADLEEKGIEFKTNCDTEVVLYSYIIYGEKCAKMLNGIFAFCIYDESKRHIYLARDRFGIKPFFYTFYNDTFYFASEIKSLLTQDEIKPIIDKKGLWQLLFLAPITLSGCSVFKNIFEVEPAYCGVLCADGLRLNKYFELTPEKLDVTPSEAADEVRRLLLDTVNRQVVADVPLCSFLSGGLDSSALSALAAKEYEKRGQKLSTYSFEYEGNKENFKKSLFQPQGDDDFAVYLADVLSTDHTILKAPTKIVAEYLEKAVYHRDFPGQADIDSSLLYFCEQVKKRHTVAMSGECSDEIFGGYPWFYREEMLYSDFFPFIHDPFARIGLFDDKVVLKDEGFEFLSGVYKDDINSVKVLESDSSATKTARVATILSVKYFMTNLLERKDRMSMASSLEVRVPFADHRLAQFVYNVPWEIKFENGVEKALLRNAMVDFLPEKILYRKKSPYPKTHNPEYERLVSEMLDEKLKSGDSRLAMLLDFDVYKALKGKENITWFGQLMQKPQLLAWLLQLEYFLQEYNCIIE